MIIRIEPESDIPIYRQLTNQILEGIARNELHPGDSLPSVRTFAADLGINMHTINKSYHELEKKRIIQITPKSGAIISPPIMLDQPLIQRISDEFKPLISEALAVGMEEDKITELITSIIHSIRRG